MMTLQGSYFQTNYTFPDKSPMSGVRPAAGFRGHDAQRPLSLAVVVNLKLVMTDIIANICVPDQATKVIPQHHRAWKTIWFPYVPAPGETLAPGTNYPQRVPESYTRKRPADNMTFGYGDFLMSPRPFEYVILLPAYVLLMTADATMATAILPAITSAVLRDTIITLHAVVQTEQFRASYDQVRLLLDEADFSRWSAWYLVRVLLSVAFQHFLVGDILGFGPHAVLRPGPIPLSGVSGILKIPHGLLSLNFATVGKGPTLATVYQFSVPPLGLVRSRGSRRVTLARPCAGVFLTGMAGVVSLLCNPRRFETPLYISNTAFSQASPQTQMHYAPVVYCSDRGRDAFASRAYVHVAFLLLPSFRAQQLHSLFREGDYLSHAATYPSQCPTRSWVRMRAVQLAPAFMNISSLPMTAEAAKGPESLTAVETHAQEYPVHIMLSYVRAKHRCVPKVLFDMRRLGDCAPLMMQTPIALEGLHVVVTDDVRVDMALAECFFAPLLVLANALLQRPPCGSGDFATTGLLECVSDNGSLSIAPGVLEAAMSSGPTDTAPDVSAVPPVTAGGAGNVLRTWLDSAVRTATSEFYSPERTGHMQRVSPADLRLNERQAHRRVQRARDVDGRYYTDDIARAMTAFGRRYPKRRKLSHDAVEEMADSDANDHDHGDDYVDGHVDVDNADEDDGAGTETRADPDITMERQQSSDMSTSGNETFVGSWDAGLAWYVANVQRVVTRETTAEHYNDPREQIADHSLRLPPPVLRK